MTTITRPGDGMSKAEVALLLAFIASYDQRTIGDADVEAWHLLVRPGRWTTPYARRAVIEHATSATGERLLPGHITQRIRERREYCAKTYRHEPCPDEVRGNVDREVAWEDAQIRGHIERCMDAWARGEDGTS